MYEGFGSFDSSSSSVKIPLFLVSITSTNKKGAGKMMYTIGDLNTDAVLIVSKFYFGNIQPFSLIKFLFIF